MHRPMTAFDYDRQEWVDGEAARNVALRQLRKDRELVAGPRGPKYLALQGAGKSRAQALAEIDAAINAWERA